MYYSSDIVARVSVVLVALVLASACSESEKSAAREVARIEDPRHDSQWPRALVDVSGALLVLTEDRRDAFELHAGLLRLDARGTLRSIAYSLPGGAFCVAGGRGYQVSLLGDLVEVNLEKGTAREVAKLGGNASGIAATAGGLLVVGAGMGENSGDSLVRVDPATGSVKAIPMPDVKAVHGLRAVAADGQDVVVATPVEGVLFRVGADGTVTPAPPAQPFAYEVSLTPAAIVLIRGKETREIVALPRSGGAAKVIAAISPNEDVQLATRGDQVYYSDRGKLRTAPVDGSGQPRELAAVGHVTAIHVDDRAVTWSEEVPGGWSIRRIDLAAR